MHNSVEGVIDSGHDRARRPGARPAPAREPAAAPRRVAPRAGIPPRAPGPRSGPPTSRCGGPGPRAMPDCRRRARTHVPAISILMRSLHYGGDGGGGGCGCGGGGPDRFSSRPVQFRALNWELSINIYAKRRSTDAKRRISEALPAGRMAVNPQRPREPLCSSVQRAKPVHLLNPLASEIKNQVGTGTIGPETDRRGKKQGRTSLSVRGHVE